MSIFRGYGCEGMGMGLGGVLVSAKSSKLAGYMCELSGVQYGVVWCIGDLIASDYENRVYEVSGAGYTLSCLGYT